MDIHENTECIHMNTHAHTKATIKERHTKCLEDTEK